MSLESRLHETEPSDPVRPPEQSDKPTFKEIAAGTFAWYSIFLPVVGKKIKKKLFGETSDAVDRENERLIGNLRRGIDNAGGRKRDTLNYVALSGKARRLYDSMTRLDVLGSIEQFWGCWNPWVTKKTSHKVYVALGGNKRPVVSTLGTFAYTGVFLHAAVVAPLAIGQYVVADNPRTFSDMVFVSSMYVALGVPVAAKKALKRKQESKPMKEKYGALDRIKATVTGGIMAAYACGAWQVGECVADMLFK